jgi:hypothetical protein
VLDGGFRCVIGLYTPMKTLQRIDRRAAGEPEKRRIASCEEFCYTHAHALLADSDAVISEIESAYGIRLPRERLAVIPLGLPDRRESVGGDDLPAPPGVTILFVGRLEKRKGVDTLLACLPPLLDRFPDARMVLAGRDDLPGDDGLSYRAAFEASAAGQRLGDRVRFLGPVSDEELIRLYAGCAIFVAPSRYESFGLILLEAMMFAKAVVAGDTGGMREVVRHGDNGLLVEPGNVEALGQALAELCGSEELRARFGARSRQIYEEHFTSEPMVRRVNQFYDRLAGRDTAGSASHGTTRAGSG